MHVPWASDLPGVLTLPSGLRVRGRALRRGPAEGEPVPTFGVYLLAESPHAFSWEWRWLRWPDFRLPADRVEAADVLREAWQRLDTDRVEVACRGGRGRTGTALACLVAIDAGGAVDPVSYVRGHYHRHAVETPWQRHYVSQFVEA